MRVLVILNGISRKKKLFYRRIFPPLKQHFNPEVWETEYSGHAEELAAKGAASDFDVILSAGGDGTIHHVVNGIMRHEKPALLVGLIPLGSGNDLARSLGVSREPQQIIDRVKRRRAMLVDVGTINAFDKAGNRITRYFINECSLGMGPEVVRRVNAGGRALSAGLMYSKSIVATFLFHKPQELRIRTSDLTWSGKSRVTAVANGKTFGHGNYIAPNASMSDGRLNLFIAGNPSLLRFLKLLLSLKRPRESTDKCLTYDVATRVEITSTSPAPLEADGEPVGYSPVICGVAPRKLKFLY